MVHRMRVRIDPQNSSRVEVGGHIILPHGIFVARSVDLQMGVSEVGTARRMKLIHAETALLAGNAEEVLAFLAGLLLLLPFPACVWRS